MGSSQQTPPGAWHSRGYNANDEADLQRKKKQESWSMTDQCNSSGYYHVFFSHHICLLGCPRGFQGSSMRSSALLKNRKSWNCKSGRSQYLQLRLKRHENANPLSLYILEAVSKRTRKKKKILRFLEIRPSQHLVIHKKF